MNAEPSSSGLDLSPFESEHTIRELAGRFGDLDLKKYGTVAWMRDHAKFEQLNRQAHVQAMHGTDEFIVDLVLQSPEGFLSKVVGELVSIGFWKEKIFPPLNACGAIEAALTARSYLVFYHESVLLNFLEVALFNRSAVAVLADHVVDLTDCLHAKILAMCRVQSALRQSWKQGLLVAASAGDATFAQQVELFSFTQGLTAINLLRFLVEGRSSAPVTFTGRILSGCDFPLLLVPLLDQQPWVRQVPVKKTGVLVSEKYEDGQWQPVTDFIPKTAAQILLILYAIVLDPQCIAQYDLRSSSLRRDNLLRVRKFLTTDVVDQIPLLEDLLRALEELAISGGIAAGGLPDKSATTAALFRVEIVPEFRDALDRKSKAEIEEIVLWLKTHVYRRDSQSDAQEIARALSVYEDENFFVGVSRDTNCPVCQTAADQRCSLCKNVFYCSRACQVQDWPSHKGRCKNQK